MFGKVKENFKKLLKQNHLQEPYIQNFWDLYNCRLKLESQTSSYIEKSFLSWRATLDKDIPVSKLADLARKFLIPQHNLINNLESLLEYNGVRVLTLPLGNELSSFSLEDKESGPTIILNLDDNPLRKRFSLAFELYQLLVQNVPIYGNLLQLETSDISFNERATISRKLGNLFAADFLLPKPQVQSILSKESFPHLQLDWENLLTLKNLFQVSAEVMIKRLQQIEQISDTNYKSLISTLNTHYKSNNYSEPEIILTQNTHTNNIYTKFLIKSTNDPKHFEDIIQKTTK